MKRVFYWLSFLLWLPCIQAATCTVSTTGLAFGSHDPISGSPTDTLGTISVTCTGTIGENVSYQIALSTGTGSYSNREMSGGVQTMMYNIFTDASRSVVWGDGSGSTGTVADAYTLDSTMVTRDYTVYSRTYSGQYSLTAQSYSDSILVTLSY